MKKSLLLSALSISIGILQTQAIAYEVSPATEMTSWVGKYITLHGNGGNNVNRYLFDRDGTTNLSAQTGHSGPANYWYVEADETYGGIYLKNAVTDRYVGTLHINDISWTGMTEDKANAGIFMVYDSPANNPSYVLTSTAVRSNGNKNNPTSGTLGNNARVCHDEGETKGYASFDNTGNESKVWLFCTTSGTGIVNVSAFGNPNGNSHWVIDSYDEDYVVNEAAQYAVRERFPNADEQAITEFANTIVAGLDASLTTFAQKYAAINAAANAHPYTLVDKTSLIGKYITIKGAGTANMGRYMFNDDVQTNLMAQRNYADLNKYWIAEANDAAESLGGVYLKNAITGKYIGQISTTNSQTIPMVTDKASAGEVMIYQKGEFTYITTATVRNNQGTSIVNPLICTEQGILKGCAKENNIDGQRLWMVCANTATNDNPYKVDNYGTGNINSHWTVETTTDDAIVTAVLTTVGKQNATANFPDMSDEEINAWVAEIIAGSSSETNINARHTDVLESTRYLAKHLDGKTLIIGNADAEKAANGYRLAIVDNVLKLSNITDKAATAWTVTYVQEEDGVKLSIGDRYIGRMPATTSGAFTLTDAENAGCYRFYRSDNDFALTCTRMVDNGEKVEPIGKMGGGTDNTANFWMQGPDNNGNVKRWGSLATTSHWALALVEDYEESATPIAVGITFENSTHAITLTHADGLSKHDPLLYDDTLVITISKTDPTETAEPSTRTSEIVAQITHSDITVGEGGLICSISDPYLEPGRYRMDIPAGMFKVGSNMDSKAHSLNFTVNEDYTTGITEIEDAETAGCVIYDLQGRRLAAPAKGINIINGRKVLVK